MNKKVIFLDLFSIKFPIMAIVSILHRVSGILLFLLLPVVLYILHFSLLSQDNFLCLKKIFMSTIGKVFIWITLSILYYHLIAGVRHMLMDYGIGETKITGRYSSRVVFSSFIVIFLIIGIWLW